MYGYRNQCGYQAIFWITGNSVKGKTILLDVRTYSKEPIDPYGICSNWGLWKEMEKQIDLNQKPSVKIDFTEQRVGEKLFNKWWLHKQ